jgi:signal peptide peptidase-like protein 2B
MTGETAAQYEPDAEAGEMKLSTTFAFVVVASCSLLLIFYFMKAMEVLVTILFSFLSTLALGALIYPYVDYHTDYRFAEEKTIPVLGEVPMLAIILSPVCGGVTLAWLITKWWILNNILAFSLIVFFLTSVRLSSLKVGASLLSLAFFYDIFWVFISGDIFGKNVMVTVATGLNVPIKMLIPLVYPHGPHASFTLIGLGDIVLPGLMVCFALRFDATKDLEWRTGYFAAAIAGYAVGLTMCEIVVGTLHVAQPAMIYLVPGVLGSMCLMAHKRGELPDLWEGIAPGHERLDDDDHLGLVEDGEGGIRPPVY